MSSITISFSILILAFILFEWSECKVLSLHREAYRPGYGVQRVQRVRGYAPGRGRWFRTYGRPGYNGGYYNRGGYGDNNGDGYDGGYGNGDVYDRENYDRDVDIRNRENVKVNVKVYTGDNDRHHHHDHDHYDHGYND